MTQVDVVIPTKSNIEGVNNLLSSIKDNPLIRTIYIVADGERARSRFNFSGPNIEIRTVAEESGIHVMWNICLNELDDSSHILFINDDIDMPSESIDGMSTTLDSFPEVGLVCPNYSGTTVELPYRSVVDICGGRYDGTGGMAGFCMMLRNSLRSEWRFDESMKWWFGDNDIVNWIVHTKGLVAAISPLATCANNKSWTITYDPPKNFYNDIKMDQMIFERKWA